MTCFKLSLKSADILTTLNYSPIPTTIIPCTFIMLEHSTPHTYHPTSHRNSINPTALFYRIPLPKRKITIHQQHTFFHPSWHARCNPSMNLIVFVALAASSYFVSRSIRTSGNVLKAINLNSWWSLHPFVTYTSQRVWLCRELKDDYNQSK